MNRIEDLVKKEIAITVGTSDIKYIESIDIKNTALTRIAKQVAREIFKNLEKKRDKLWRHKCKYGLRERVEFLKDDYDEVKKEWLGDEE